MVVLTIFMFKKNIFLVIFPRAMYDMDWTHYDGAERAMSEAKQVFAFKNRWSQSLTLIREVQADVSKQSLDYKAKRGLSTMKPEFEEKNTTISFSLSVHCTDSENFFATESANLSKNTLNFPLTANYSYCVIIKKVLKTIYLGNVYEIGKQLFELCIHTWRH